MYRASPVSRRVPSTAGRGVVRVVRRRLTSEATTPLNVPKKKPRILRRIILATATATGTFYVGSTFIAFNNQPYYDFFSDHVPLGQSMLEYAEARSWDTMTPQSALESAKKSAISTQKSIMDTINRTPAPRDVGDNVKQTAERKAHDAKEAALKIYKESKARVQTVATNIKTDIEKQEGLTGKAGAIAKHQADQLSDAVTHLVRQAEDAISGKFPEHVSKSLPPSLQPEPSPAASSATEPSARDVSNHVYDTPLPVGFEPPPGFSRPAPPKKVETVEEKPLPPSLPLLAPALEALTSSEPVLAHLAGTIDNLASFLKSHPQATAQVTPVLEKAKGDLAALAERIDKVRSEERAQLEAKIDEQTREYTIKSLELEMEAQDKLDNQEDEFRKFYDQERMKFAQAYREKLEHELKTQTELINERLKQEVIAQGVELQRRWIREIKVHVEQERGGRLSKIDELSAHLKRLERVALDNSTYLDENIRVHALWSAVRAVSSSALTSPVRKPFREELRVLRHIAASREDPVVSATLESLESSEVPDVGVEPFADLASWFTSSVAPKVSSVALVPDTNAGVLSHVASHLLSGFRFRRQGLVEGDDTLSVLARAEYHLNEKDLDSATRELNQLQGTARLLLQDWLDAARRRLEVQQALEVVQTQATLASLLVV